MYYSVYFSPPQTDELLYRSFPQTETWTPLKLSDMLILVLVKVCVHYFPVIFLHKFKVNIVILYHCSAREWLQ